MHRSGGIVADIRIGNMEVANGVGCIEHFDSLLDNFDVGKLLIVS